jgi:hypothetical protein
MTSSHLAKMARAAAVIESVLGQDFVCHTRKEWDGEYGKGALLILQHESCDPLYPYVNYDGLQYGKIEQLSDALSAAGFWVEDCTGWYSGVYEKEVANETSVC